MYVIIHLSKHIIRTPPSVHPHANCGLGVMMMWECSRCASRNRRAALAGDADGVERLSMWRGGGA